MTIIEILFYNFVKCTVNPKTLGNIVIMQGTNEPRA